MGSQHKESCQAVTCDKCPFECGSQEVLTHHKLECHIDHKCFQCDNVFTSEENLNTHFETVHSKEQLCSYCDFSAATESDINTHIMLHQQPKCVYNCEKQNNRAPTNDDIINFVVAFKYEVIRRIDDLQNVLLSNKSNSSGEPTDLHQTDCPPRQHSAPQ